MPVRIQLSRRKGWRMPRNTRRVARPSFFGNRFPVIQDRLRWWCMLAPDQGLVFRSERAAASQAVICYQELIDHSQMLRDAAIVELRGKNLGCWCALCPTHAAGKPFDVDCPDCAPCHADHLGIVANAPLLCESIDG